MNIFYKFSIFLCLFLATLSMSAQAADRHEGNLSFGYFDGQGIETDFVFGDFTLRYEPTAWGAEIGMFGVVGRLHETYAAATYTTDAGKLAFGFPRPAYDEFGTSALTTMMPRLSLGSIGQIRSRTTYGTMYLPEFLPYGALYSARADMLDYAISLHAVPGYPDVILGGGLRRSQGTWTVDLAVETVVIDAETLWNTKAQIVGDLGVGTLGLGLFNPQANDQSALIEAFGTFEAGADTEITGLVRAGPETSPAFGLGLSRQITQHLVAQGGMFGSDIKNLSASANLQLQF